MAQEAYSQTSPNLLLDDSIGDFFSSLGVDEFWDDVGRLGWKGQSEPRDVAKEGEGKYIITFSGHSQQNPGPSGAAFAIYRSGEATARDRIYLEKKTVSLYSTLEEAQYFGLIYGLEKVLELKARSVEIESSSEFIVNQLKHGIDANDYRFQPLHTRASDLLAQLPAFTMNLSVLTDEEVVTFATEAAEECAAKPSRPIADFGIIKRRRVSESEVLVIDTPSTDSAESPKPKRWRQ